MTLTVYKEFIKTLEDKPNYSIEFHLPGGIQLPTHYHITDVGAVNRYFIDCGGQTREENYVQIQLWLGKNNDHCLDAKTILKILKNSNKVLCKLPNLNDSNVFIEYKTEFITQYPIAKIDVLNGKIICFTKHLTTQCLVALRHEQELNKGAASDCRKASCC